MELLKEVNVSSGLDHQDITAHFLWPFPSYMAGKLKSERLQKLLVFKYSTKLVLVDGRMVVCATKDSIISTVTGRNDIKMGLMVSILGAKWNKSRYTLQT